VCGIAGFIGFDIPNEERIALTLALMEKRGPDARGVYHGRLRDSNICLLHTRLSIIDTNPRSNQPFKQDDCVLIFNGEIYNYIELRQELEALGHHFHTASDTEIIVKAWRQWERSCVNRFEGMWTLALLDERSGELFFSRDPFGEKPFYYMVHERSLYFGSETKFLAALSGHKPSVNLDHVRRYLVNGYKALYKKPHTFFADIRELPPSSSAVLTAPEVPQTSTYWSLEHRTQAMSREEAVVGARDHLYEALRIRLRSDVPLAFCLSGGVDSSALAAIAALEFNQEVHAFSIVDKDIRYNESKNIQATVAHLGCDHDIIETDTKDFLGRLERLVAYHDAPVATISYYMHAFLSEAINQAGYKVSLSGTGADELFTGYYDHYGMWLAEIRDRSDFQEQLDGWRSSYGSFVRNPLLKDPLAFASNPNHRDHIFFNTELFEGFLTCPFHEDFEETLYSDNLLRNRMLNELWNESVPVILHEDDLNSMMHSVENRSPYLDRGLAEFMYTVPSDHLIHDGYAKFLLRSAVEGLVPDSVRLDKRKRGFNASIESLFDRTDADNISFLLSDSPIFDIVDRRQLETFLSQDMTDNSFSKFLFNLISAKMFLDNCSA
jgi:asparagine synthase (glutamine-hydrolysing)